MRPPRLSAHGRLRWIRPNTVASTNLALAYAIQGDVGRAETLLMNNSSTASGHYNVGVLRLSLGRYAGAAQAFDQAAAAQPSFWLARRRAIQARVAYAGAAERC